MNEMESEVEYKTIDLIAQDVETLQKNYMILLEYVKKLELKNRRLQYEKEKLEKQLNLIKKNKEVLILEELL